MRVIARTVGIAAIVAAASGWALPAGAAGAVLTPSDGVDEYNTDAGHCSLREAIQAAQGSGSFNGCSFASDDDADTIQLSSGVTYNLSLVGAEDLNAAGDLDVIGQTGDRTLTIATTGAGRATIDANGSSTGDRVIETRGTTSANFITLLTLDNLQLTDGETTGEGGALLTHGWTFGVSIASSWIRRNEAGIAGAMRLNAGNTTIDRSLIEENTAQSVGAIWLDVGNLTLDESTVSDNQALGPAATGGGISANGSYALTLTNSTVSGNDVVGNAGGLYLQQGFGTPTATIANTTIAGNSATGAGGGISLLAPMTASIRNSIVADNTDSGGSPDCSGTLNSQGHNLLESLAGCTLNSPSNEQIGDPLLGPLADNGGPTPTMALLPGSPALDGGNPLQPGTGGNACEGADQRGLSRLGSIEPCDIGAFELQQQPPSLAPVGDRSVQAGQTLAFNLAGSDPNPGDSLSYSAVNLPSGASLHPTTGAFSWTPSAAQVGSFPGVQFEVSDGAASDADTITITVTAAPPEPAPPTTTATTKKKKKCKKGQKKVKVKGKVKCKKKKKGK